MKHGPKLLNQTQMCTSLKEKILKLTKSPQVIMLISIVLIKHHQFTCPLLNVSPPYQLKRCLEKSVTFHTLTKIGDKRCKVIVDSECCINAISSKSLEFLGLEVEPHPTHSKCLGLTSRHLRSNNDVLSQSISISLQRQYLVDVITMNVG